jgi:hypothetical protein
MAPTETPCPPPLLGTRLVRVGSWVLSGLCFVIGSVIGMTVSPQLGISLWFAAGLFALLPFVAHRNYN